MAKIPSDPSHYFLTLIECNSHFPDNPELAIVRVHGKWGFREFKIFDNAEALNNFLKRTTDRYYRWIDIKEHLLDEKNLKSFLVPEEDPEYFPLVQLATNQSKE